MQIETIQPRQANYTNDLQQFNRTTGVLNAAFHDLVRLLSR